jgi:hypothetical protein
MDSLFKQVVDTLCLFSEYGTNNLDLLTSAYNFHPALIKIISESQNSDLRIVCCTLVTRLCHKNKDNKHVVIFLQQCKTPAVEPSDLLQAFKTILRDPESSTKLVCAVLLCFSNLVADTSPEAMPIILRSHIYEDTLLPLLLDERFHRESKIQCELAYSFTNAFIVAKDFQLVRGLTFECNFMSALVKLIERGTELKNV